MIKLLLSISILLSTALAFAKKDGPICLNSQNFIAEGDVVFTSNHNYLFRRVERDTLTWTSHTGQVFKNEFNEWVVYESTWPKSKITPLCEFMQRSYDDRVEIKRLSSGLTASQIRVMKMAATRQLGLPYDQGFDYDDNKKSFCSKFVYNNYKAIGIEIGLLHTFQDLLDENPDMDITFWKVWYFGQIPYTRTTITPGDLIRDTEFTSVFKHNID